MAAVLSTEFHNRSSQCPRYRRCTELRGHRHRNRHPRPSCTYLCSRCRARGCAERGCAERGCAECGRAECGCAVAAVLSTECHNRSSRCPRYRSCTRLRGRRRRIRHPRPSCTCLSSRWCRRARGGRVRSCPARRRGRGRRRWRPAQLFPPCRSAGGGAEQT